MPMPLRDLEEKQCPLKDRVYEVLKTRSASGLALTVPDVWGALEGLNVGAGALTLALLEPEQRASPLVLVAVALAQLVKAGRVTEGKDGGMSYFYVRRPARFDGVLRPRDCEDSWRAGRGPSHASTAR